MTEIARDPVYGLPVKPLYDINDIMEFLGVNRCTVYRMRKRGQFPEPVEIGDRKQAWPRKVLIRWLDELAG